MDKYISGYYDGYTLASKYSGLTISQTGSIGGPGLVAVDFATIVNDGSIHSTDIGVRLQSGGTVINDGSIHGADFGVILQSGGMVTNGAGALSKARIDGATYGIAAEQAASVANYGTIYSTGAAIYLGAGGSVTNGSTSTSSGLIQGLNVGVDTHGQSATVTNYGTIVSDNGVAVSLGAGGLLVNRKTVVGYEVGVSASAVATIDNQASLFSLTNATVYLADGGSVINGSASGAGPAGYAVIRGGIRNVSLVETAAAVVALGVATVTNFGIIESLYGDAIDLAAGGSVYNSARSSIITGEYITTPGAGACGIVATGAATIANLGEIAGYKAAIFLEAGGTVTNGAAGAPSMATIGINYERGNGTYIREGYDGVYASNVAATVANYGTIEAFGVGAKSAGVRLDAGGRVTNGSIGDYGALITGQIAILDTGRATIINDGDLYGSHYVGGVGVEISGRGSVVNGSATDSAARITAYIGVLDRGGATIINYGGLQGGQYGGAGIGVEISGGGSVINGSATDSAVAITGSRAIVAGGGVTVTNFGLIAGGVAIEFSARTDRLIAEAGSYMFGGVEGGHGTLELAGGSGTIVGLGEHGAISGDITMSLGGFGSYILDAGGTWTLAEIDQVNAQTSMTQFCDVYIGDASAAASLTIAPAGLWTIENDSGIFSGAAAGSLLRNRGVLVKSGGVGTSVIGVNVVNTGSIMASSGTLDFTHNLSGTGIVSVDAGATLEFDGAVGTGVTASFDGAGGRLAITRPPSFRATIDGFETGDTIDLLGRRATGASLNADDQLVIVDGAHTVATLQLSGTYTNPVFSVGSDGHGGSNVMLLTASPEVPSPAPAASTQAFAAAMAGRGAEAAHTHASPAARLDTWAIGLVAPRAHPGVSME